MLYYIISYDCILAMLHQIRELTDAMQHCAALLYTASGRAAMQLGTERRTVYNYSVPCWYSRKLALTG